jgi:hypothetical protein
VVGIASEDLLPAGSFAGLFLKAEGHGDVCIALQSVRNKNGRTSTLGFGFTSSLALLPMITLIAVNSDPSPLLGPRPTTASSFLPAKLTSSVIPRAVSNVGVPSKLGRLRLPPGSIPSPSWPNTNPTIFWLTFPGLVSFSIPWPLPHPNRAKGLGQGNQGTILRPTFRESPVANPDTRGTPSR